MSLGYLWGMGCAGVMVAHKTRIYRKFLSLRLRTLSFIFGHEYFFYAYRFRRKYTACLERGASNFHGGVRGELLGVCQRHEPEIRRNETNNAGTEEIQRG